MFHNHVTGFGASLTLLRCSLDCTNMCVRLTLPPWIGHFVLNANAVSLSCLVVCLQEQSILLLSTVSNFLPFNLD